MIVINAKEQVAGRIAARAAKLLLAGEEVAIVNSEQAVVSGMLQTAVDTMTSRRSQRNKRDPNEGPKYPSLPHLYLRRIVKGMLPKKSQRGRDALHKLRCYTGVPEGVDVESAVKPYEKANKPLGALRKSTTIGAVCGAFGWKA